MEDIKLLFGKRIKELRIKCGLSQENLSEMIDIAERNLSKIECGKSFIRAEKIGKLASALGVKPKDLFEFESLRSPENLKKDLIIDIELMDIDTLRILYNIVQAIK